jgi:hypothetical protein
VLFLSWVLEKVFGPKADLDTESPLVHFFATLYYLTTASLAWLWRSRWGYFHVGQVLQVDSSDNNQLTADDRVELAPLPSLQVHNLEVGGDWRSCLLLVSLVGWQGTLAAYSRPPSCACCLAGGDCLELATAGAIHMTASGNLRTARSQLCTPLMPMLPLSALPLPTVQAGPRGMESHHQPEPAPPEQV